MGLTRNSWASLSFFQPPGDVLLERQALPAPAPRNRVAALFRRQNGIDEIFSPQPDIGGVRAAPRIHALRGFAQGAQVADAVQAIRQRKLEVRHESRVLMVRPHLVGEAVASDRRGQELGLARDADEPEFLFSAALGAELVFGLATGFPPHPELRVPDPVRHLFHVGGCAVAAVSVADLSLKPQMIAFGDDPVAGAEIGDFHGRVRVPVERDIQRLPGFVPVRRVEKTPEMHGRPAVAEAERGRAVRRVRRLLQQQQRLQQAGLAGAVGAEKAGDRAQLDLPGVAPGLEAFQAHSGEHRFLSGVRRSAACPPVRLL